MHMFPPSRRLTQDHMLGVETCPGRAPWARRAVGQSDTASRPPAASKLSPWILGRVSTR